MKGRKFVFSILLLFLIFSSCKNEPELDEDLWVGSIRVLDRNIPFPFLIERTEMGLYLIDHKNKVLDSTTEHRARYEAMDTIKMQDHQFLVVKGLPSPILFDIKDSLNFPYLHPLYTTSFVKAENSKAIDISSFKEDLQANTYQNEVESAHFATPNRDLKVVKTLKFSEDRLQTFYTYYYQNAVVYSEKEEAEYHIFERKGKVFLSEGQEQANSQNLYQVSEVGVESFIIKTFRDFEETTEYFKISKKTEIPTKTRVFERCMEGQPGEYSHDDTTYSKGNEYLIRSISENAPEATGDGYITVHFTINCKGKMGHLGLEQMDRNFQSTSFELALVQHIISEVMDLKDWPEFKPDLFYKDIHSFLMFRIKNGKITDLCP